MPVFDYKEVRVQPQVSTILDGEAIRMKDRASFERSKNVHQI